MKKKENRRYIIAVLLMVFAGIISSQGFIETSLFVKRYTLVKYSIYFLWLVLIALIGGWAWNGSGQPWMLKVWVWAYGAAILLLLLLGIVDVWLFPFPSYIKKDISHFREFFLSPAVFAVLFLLTKIRTIK